MLGSFVMQQRMEKSDPSRYVIAVQAAARPVIISKQELSNNSLT